MTGSTGLLRLTAVASIAALVAFGVQTQAVAAAAEAWRAIQVEGEARITTDQGLAMVVKSGTRYPVGHTLETGPRGRVVLARGSTSITVGATSRMKIPEDGDTGARTKIFQALGSLLFKVEKRASQHFEVETPYLAAVVKGTTFTVSVDDEASAVHVVEGAVQVTDLASGEVGLVKPGLTAVVSPRRGGGLTILGGEQTDVGPGPSPAAGEDDRASDEAAAVGDGSGAAGRAKRLRVMLGETAVDVVKTSNGFVRNAASAAGPVQGMGASTGRRDAGNAGGNAFGHGNGNVGNGNPVGGPAFGHNKGNPGGGNAYGHNKNNGNAYGHNKDKNKNKGNSGNGNSNNGNGNGNNGNGNGNT